MKKKMAHQQILQLKTSQEKTQKPKKSSFSGRLMNKRTSKKIFPEIQKMLPKIVVKLFYNI